MKTKPVASSVVNLIPAGEGYNNIFFEQKIVDVTSGLIPHFRKLLYKISRENAWIIASYITTMRTEINLSDHYRRDIIKVLTRFSIFCNGKSFRQINRDEILSFLDSFRKPENEDPISYSKMQRFASTLRF